MQITMQSITLEIEHLVGFLFNWLVNRSPRFWRWIALGLLTGLTAVVIFKASVVVDGTRYFWLDDDQMISMRYARNLAQGDGLVWNPGERIEGYTNFLWTLIMAGVHLLPIADAYTSLVVKIVNWALTCAILLLSERLLCYFLPKPGLALPALFTMLVLCKDLLFWSVNGYETTLLAALFLLVVTRILNQSARGQTSLGTYLLIGLLPLVRSDAYYAWASVLVLSLGLTRNIRRELGMLGWASLFPVVHLFFRYWYYGEWLPNTFYLKVAGEPQLVKLGIGYAWGFLSAFAIPLTFGLVGFLTRRDRQTGLLLGGLIISTIYVIWVGGDIFTNHRFFAHLVPIILVLALIAVSRITTTQNVAQATMLLVLVLTVLMQDGVYSPNGISHLISLNGVPEPSLVAGLMIQHFTNPDARVAVFAAGNIPYFSHRYSIDLLGKSDYYIARLPSTAQGMVGHDKFDPDYSFALEPDLIVMLYNYNQVINIEAAIPHAKLFNFDDRIPPFLISFSNNVIFKSNYRINPVPVPYVMEHTSVYVRNFSPEQSRLGQWQTPQISR